MHRRLVTRTFAAFIASWFLLVMIEPEAIHTCPVHAAASTGHAGHGSSHADGTQMPTAPAGAHCSCPGDCAASALSNPIPSAPVWHVALIETPQRTAMTPTPLRPVQRVEFLIPFANGPPSVPIA